MAKINAACSLLSTLSASELQSKIIEIAKNFKDAHLSCEDWSAHLVNEPLLWHKNPTAYALWQMVYWKENLIERLSVPQGDKRWGNSTYYSMVRSKAMCVYADLGCDAPNRNTDVAIAIDGLQHMLSCSQEDAIRQWSAAYKSAQVLVAKHAFGVDLADAHFEMPVEGLSDARVAVVNMFGRLVSMPFARGSKITHIQKSVAPENHAVIRYCDGIYEQAQNQLPQAVLISKEGRWSDEVYQRIFAANRRTFSSEQEQAAIKQQFPDFVAACEPFAEMPDLWAMAFVPALMNYWLQKTAGASERLIALCNE